MLERQEAGEQRLLRLPAGSGPAGANDGVTLLRGDASSLDSKRLFQSLVDLSFSSLVTPKVFKSSTG